MQHVTPGFALPLRGPLVHRIVVLSPLINNERRVFFRNDDKSRSRKLAWPAIARLTTECLDYTPLRGILLAKPRTSRQRHPASSGATHRKTIQNPSRQSRQTAHCGISAERRWVEVNSNWRNPPAPNSRRSFVSIRYPLTHPSAVMAMAFEGNIRSVCISSASSACTPP